MIQGKETGFYLLRISVAERERELFKPSAIPGYGKFATTARFNHES
jgi:hypothetical protein